VLEQARLLVLRVEQEGHSPISNARLLLLEDPYSNPQAARADVRSDDTGHAEIELQAGGSWFVHASHPSYKTVALAVSDSGAARIELTVVLAAGLRVRGQVRTARTLGSGRPEVVIDEWGPSPTRILDCDSEGRFDSGPVFSADSELELTAKAPGFAEERRVVHLAKAVIVENVCEVDFQLDDKEARVVGRVVTRDPRSPGTADVFVQPLAAGPFLEARKLTSPAVRWRAQAVSDTSGRFEIGGLAAHQGYQLEILPREHFSNALVRIPPLHPGETRDIGTVEVEAGGTLFGFARFEDGTAVPHLHITGIATVSMTWDQMNDPGHFPRRDTGRQDAYSTLEGRFELALLPGGTTYTIYWGDGRPDEKRRVGEYVIRSGESIGPIEIVVPSQEGESISTSGVVTDAGGRPLDSILVEAWNGPATTVIGEGFEAGKLTEDDGRFVLSRLAAGREHRFTATDLRGRFAKGEWTMSALETQDTLTLRLEPSPAAPRRLEGIVTDARGRPLEGIDLTLFLTPLLVRCDCVSWRQRTDELGAFSFGLVTEGSHQLAATDPGGRYRAQLVEVRPGIGAAVVME
jgi:hypothetical protein